MRIGIEGNRAGARHTISEGERRSARSPGPRRSAARAPSSRPPSASSHRHTRAAGSRTMFPDHPWRCGTAALGARVKGLTFSTGALSPRPPRRCRRPGARRNWNYRYCWLRDFMFTLSAFTARHGPGGTTSSSPARPRAQRGRRAVPHLLDQRRNDLGERSSTTCAATTARGRSASETRCNQRQNDVYGVVLDPSDLYAKQRDDRLWLGPRDEVEQVRGARAGLRPTRKSRRRCGEPRHYVSSKLMCRVALDRGARRPSAVRTMSAPSAGS